MDTSCYILVSQRQNKEDNTMKSTTLCKPVLPYPNAATRRQLLHRLLDLLLSAAIGAGVAAVLLFLLALA